MSSLLPKKVSVVLSQTIWPSNIGGSARAMANMGFERLVLVAPQCEVDYSAHQAAASSQKPLEDHVAYKSWQDFYASEGEGVLIGMTNRSGKMRQVESWESTLDELLTPELIQRPWYIVFGREDDGLSFDETVNMHRCCELPTFSEKKSLNLSQAVLLTLFIFQQKLREKRGVVEAPVVETEFVKTPRYFPEETIRVWMETLGFYLDDEKTNAFEVMKRVFLRGIPNQKELHILECVLQQDIRKLREAKKLSGQ